MDIFAQLTEKIIKEQESVIGPIALEQAQKVKGLKIDWKSRDIAFEGNKTDIVENLIEQYKKLFGQASVEMCKDAVKSIISEVPSSEVPSLLK